MKTRSISVYFLFLIFLSCSPNSKELSDSQAAVSGAYQALNNFAAQRIYPGNELPREAHFAAWEKMQQQNNSRDDEATPAWQTLGPHNFAGRTLAIAFNPQNPNTMYAGSASGGLWRSSTGGIGAQAWEFIDTKFPVLGVSSITFAPGDSMTLYIGTGEVYNFFAAGTGAAYRSTRGSYGIGILKSTDGGQNWTKSLDWSYDQNRGVWAIRVHPTQPEILYAATTHGVYKSTDAGSNWNLMLDVPMANDLLIHPSRPDELIVGCGNFGTINKGIYKTTDGGSNWNLIQSNLPTDFNGKIQLALTPTNPNVIFASIGNGFGFNDGATWLCRSTDFGTTWNIQNQTDYSKWQGWFAHDIAVNPFDSTQLTAIGIEVYKASANGLLIEQKSSGGLGYNNPPAEGPDGDPDYTHSDSHDVIYHPDRPNTFYVAHDGGIHRSDDNGETYSSCNGGMQTVQFYNGFSNSWQDSTFCLGGLQDNGSIRWNGDLTWQRLFGGDGSWSAINPVDDNTLYVSYQNLNFFRSEDRGENLNFVKPNLDGDPVVFIAPFVVDRNDGQKVVAASSRIYLSEDRGDQWTILNNELPLDGNPVLSLDFSVQNGTTIYAATAPTNAARSGVFVSTDGNIFSDITGNLPDRYPMDLTVDPTDDATAYITFSGYGTGHIFKTTDHGQNWIDISGDLPDVPTNAVIVDPLFPTNVYVGNDLGVFSSIDGGDTWSIYQKGLPTATMIFDLKISPSNRKLRIATHGNGAYQRNLLEEAFVATNDLDPTGGLRFELSPNPASGPVQVNYELPKAGQVKLVVLDVQGRSLDVLVNTKQSKGTYNFRLENNKLSAGLYFVRLQTEYGLLTKRLVLK